MGFPEDNKGTMASVYLKQLRRFLGTPSRCFTAQRRRSKALCKLLTQLAIAMGLINFAWTFFAAAPEAMVAANGPDRGRRVFDGGIKLEFVAPGSELGSRPKSQAGRKKCRSSSTCHNDHQLLSVSETPYGHIGISGLNSNRRIYKDRTSNETDIIVKSFPRIDTYPLWCSGQRDSSTASYPEAPTSSQNMTEKKYFLTAVLLVRIYAYDPAKLTTREMMQWMQYLSYAGVEHVYVYDAYFYKNESQREHLRCFIKNGYVTYVDWSHKARPKYSIAGTQVAAYQDCLNQHGRHFAWQTAIDIDEYPFCPGDRAPGFLSRAVREITQTERGNIGEISMQNYLYLGKPLDDSEHPLLIDRLWRRTIKRANPLVKPIYQPRAVRQANVHHNSLSYGYVNYAPSDNVLRMSHFWGARLQHWGEDTPEILDRTVGDRGMEMAVAALKPCLSGCEMGCC